MWALLLAGCNAHEGPCEFVEVGHVMELRTASNATTGAAIPSVFLSDIRYHDEPVRLQFVPVGPGASLESDGIRCSPACSFEKMTGPFSFDVSANGYSTKRVAVDAQWANVELGCPGRASGSTVFNVTLQPSP